MSYNGYATQDDFHKALRELIPAYVAAREASLKRDPTGVGLKHEGCDHAYGYCEEREDV